MKSKKLRIVWSVGWGIICVLLIGLWVRSYWWMDGLSGDHGNRFVYVHMERGEFHFGSMPIVGRVSPWDIQHYRITNASDANLLLATAENGFYRLLGVAWRICDGGWHFAISLWWPVVISGALAVAPWLRLPKRFGLRAWLIGLTLIALLIGWVIHDVKSFPHNEKPVHGIWLP